MLFKKQEQKVPQKSFGLILKSAKTKKQKEEKKLYTIVSCCVSAIFLITILVPVIAKKDEKSSGNMYKNVSFDLADLAVDDEAEKVLLEMQKYSDIPQQKIAGGLFDEMQKKERQETDKVEGLPAAPDTEYAQARRVREVKKSRGVRRAPITTQRTTRTSTGNLSKGSMASGGGSASSGTSATIWTSADKAGQKAKAGSTGAFNKQQLVAATGAKGRASGFMRAIEESQKAANSANADTAAQAAMDAFTNNNLEADDEGLEDAMDDFGEKFNADASKQAANNSDLTDLIDALKKEQKKPEDNTDYCTRPQNKMSMECFWGPALIEVAQKLVDAGIGMLTNYVNGQMNMSDWKEKQDYLREHNTNIPNATPPDANSSHGVDAAIGNSNVLDNGVNPPEGPGEQA